MYFSNQQSVETVKKEFTRLAHVYHPSIPDTGNEEIFKAIYSEYLTVLKNLDRSVSPSSNGEQQHTYYFDVKAEQAVVETLGRLFSLQMQSVTVALVGKWLWIKGLTQPHKEELKALGCRWSGDKEAWYWHTGKTFRSKGRPQAWNSIVSKYGYQELTNKN